MLISTFCVKFVFLSSQIVKEKMYIPFTRFRFVSYQNFSPVNFVFFKIPRCFRRLHIDNFALECTAEGNQACTWVVLVNPLLNFDQPVEKRQTQNGELGQ